MQHTRQHAFSIRALLAIICLGLFIPIQGVNAQPIYNWAVVPQFNNTAIHRDWTPVLDMIEQKTGYQFKLTFYTSISSFEVGFLKGESDFAYMNPYHAVAAKEAQGYMPIVRDGKRKLVGIIVVRKDSNINNINDLSGKTISFPSPNAFAASLYLRTLLHEKEKINFESRYAGTHQNSYRHVLSRKAAASGGVKRTLRKEKQEIQDRLKIIYQTPANPSHPIAAHPRVPEEVRNAVQNALLDMATTEEGRLLLKNILLPEPVKAVYEKDYLTLKELNVERYFVTE